MRKTKTNNFTLILIAIGLLVLSVLGFMILGLGDGLISALAKTTDGLNAVFSFSGANALEFNGIPYVLIFDIALIAIIAIFVVTWILHLVLLLAKKREEALGINLLWLMIGGLATAFLVLSFANISAEGNAQGIIFEGKFDDYYHDFIGFVAGAFAHDMVKGICGILFVAGSFLAYVLCLISVIKSLGRISKKEEAVSEEIVPSKKEDKNEEGDEDMKKPVVIQNIINGEENKAVTSEELRRIVREELSTIQPQGGAESGADEGDMMTSDDLHRLVKEETAAAIAETKFEEAIQKIVAEELRKFFVEAKFVAATPVKEKPAPAPVIPVVVEAAPVVPEPAPAPAPAPAPEPKPEPIPEPAPAPEPIPEPEPAPAPVATEPAPVEEESVAEEKTPFVRLSFAEKMVNKADQEQMSNYNELKAYALGYGLKSRLSSGGDSFRLHTKTYLRIGMVGKGLKLYFALDPADYKDSTIPVKDVSSKRLYKEIPLCFKVKSGLSMKRAKQLIDDVCTKDGLVLERAVEYVDYASEVKNAVIYDDGDEEDEVE